MKPCTSRRTKKGVCEQWSFEDCDRPMCYYHRKVEQELIVIQYQAEDNINDFKDRR